MQHPTQIFLSNPQALQAEYRLDDRRLELWWSPHAGESRHCADRKYSSRDAHLNVLQSIEFSGCGLEVFSDCDYDPYHCVLQFEGQSLHIAIAVGAPLVYVWVSKMTFAGAVTVEWPRGAPEDLRTVRHATGGMTVYFSSTGAMGLRRGAEPAGWLGRL
jgi:hypothetical protein